MDTLCQDLLNSIAAFSKASEVHVLNLRNLDSSEYLKLYTYFSRYALACANKNYHWILEYIGRIEKCQQLLLAIKYDLPGVDFLLTKFKLPVDYDNSRDNYHEINEPGEDINFIDFYDGDLDDDGLIVMDEDFISFLLIIICKYNRPHQRQLISKLLVDESMQYNCGYIQHMSGVRNISIPKTTLYYVLGLFSGGHLDDIYKVRDCEYMERRDLETVLLQVKDTKLAEIIVKTMKGCDLVLLSNRLLMHYIKNDMISILKYYHLDQTSLRAIVNKAKRPELIERHHLLKYDDIYVSVINHYAESNNTSMLDQLFDTVPRIDLFIETIYENYPTLLEYVEQKFKQVYGSRFDIDDLKIIYKKANNHSEEEVDNSSESRSEPESDKEETIINYDLLIRSQDFQSLNTKGFYDKYLINKFHYSSIIIETNSLDFIKLIIRELVKNDCIDYKQPRLDRYFEVGEGSFLTNLNYYCALKIKDLRLVAKTLCIPTGKRLKKDIILDLIQYIF